MKHFYCLHLIVLALTIGAADSAQAQVIIESKPFRVQRTAQARPLAGAAAEQPFELPIEAYVEPAATGARSARPAGLAQPAAQLPASTVAPVVVAPSPGAPAPVAPVWEIRLADNNLSRALTRWAAAAPDKLPILWEASSDLPAVAARYSGDFLSAIEQVMRDTGNSQYPLHACAHDNVVRVLHVSQPCVRSAVTASATASLGAEK